ncbi:MAG: hypothetical protein JXA68_01905, partial [Ignavibacteriales bacterium]|nr:hypothetical protein [Ignavibacteriales bacterium]
MKKKIFLLLMLCSVISLYSQSTDPVKSNTYQKLDYSDYGQGEWIYQSTERITLKSNRNGGELDVAYPSAYKWVSQVNSSAKILLYADDWIHTNPNTLPDEALKRLGYSY